MRTHAVEPAEREQGGDPNPTLPGALLDVDEVALVLKCSARTVCRLAGSGRIPRPVRLGGLVRWRREVVEDWIASGCPPCDRPRGRR